MTARYLSRRFLLAAGVSLGASRAIACVPSSDAVWFQEVSATNVGFSDTSGKTLRAAPIDPAARNCVVVTLGQSQTTNSAPTNYTPTNASKIDNLNLYDGLLYAGADPLLGCGGSTGGNWVTLFADKMIDADLADRVLLAPIALGGTGVDNWMNGPCSTRIVALAKRIAALGAAPALIFWNQGERESVLGTTPYAYTAMGLEVVANMRRLGWTAPFFVATETWSNNAVSSEIQAAQQAMVNPFDGIFPGPNADSMDLSYRIDDLTHFNDAGNDRLAELTLAAVIASGVPTFGSACPG